MTTLRRMVAGLALALTPAVVGAQEPVSWGTGTDVPFTTFSIVAVDPATGETGSIVTTRGTCVGNAVPWVRPGVGAVATQGGTRLEYGNDLLDLLAKGCRPRRRHETGRGGGRRAREPAGRRGGHERPHGAVDREAAVRRPSGDHVHMRTGPTFAVQGNSLVSTSVVNVIAENFQSTEGSLRPLADRLIEALWAGQAIGGDMRHGNKQSAAVMVADPRPGMARRPDGVSVNINVCEHAEPVGELRRVYDAASETLGFRRLELFMGRDVLQLKLMLHALGFYKATEKDIPMTGPGANLYTEEAVLALDAFRIAEEWGTTVPGHVDARVLDRLWRRLDEKGLSDDIRRKMLDSRRLR